jgi:crotonobetainyl-CoA:carnitine CoA-transferase CaiB-like acyl-CoA transferase
LRLCGIPRFDFVPSLLYRHDVTALDGIRVLDLADETGAYCGKLLADMGADVVKVEPPGGDAMRRIGPFYSGDAGAAEISPSHPDPLPEAPTRHSRGGGNPAGGAWPPHLDARLRGHDDLDANHSLFFWHYNTNKRSVVLDLQQEDGRAQLGRLAGTADVVIETFAPGHLDRLGLGYHQLARVNPRITVVSVTPFGQDGPYRDWKSSDTVAQALGGMLFVNGHPDEPPLRSLGLQAYHSASTYAAIGALLALLARERTGRGQWVDVSIQECVAATVEHVSGYFHQTGQVEVRRGTLHWSRYFRVAKCRDGYALHCSLGDWTSLIEWVKADGKAQELAEEAWEDFNHRRRNCVRLFDVLDEWAKDYGVSELVEGAQLRRIPYAAVLPPESLPSNPQLVERGFFAAVEHPELSRTLTYPGAPYRFSDSAWAIRRRPPLLGEHTPEVLEARGAEPPPSRLLGDEGEQSSPGPGSTGALAGVRVIDFTWVVAGPVATRILADHGAEVIKIERRDSLDFGSRRGGLTGNLNRGKKSIVINMSDPRGVAIAKRLVATADVVIDNFSARVMRNWGLDYESLRALKPDVITVSMSGFGHTGPHKDYVSYGPTLQALSGYTLLMRHLGREPAGWGFSYSDMAGGYNAALAVLLALWHRQRTGRGQLVDLSQFESVTALLGPLLLDVLVNHGTVQPFGNRSQERPAAPHGVYRCRDGEAEPRDRWCAITIFDDDDWARLLAALGTPSWAHEPRFATVADRVAHQDELDARVEGWTRTLTAEEVMKTLQAAGVAAGVVSNARDLCERDPHLRARGYWAMVKTPEGQTMEFDGVPVRLAETPGGVRSAGPLLGEHTDAVLQTLLGLSAAEIAALRRDFVVA